MPFKQEWKYCTAVCLIGIALVLRASCLAAPGGQKPISLYVDASESPRKLFHAELSFLVQPGPLTLVYPRWGISTYEFPTRILNDIVRLKMSGAGNAITWKRDLVDKFAFHLVIPEGVDELNVSMDVVAPHDRSDLNAATANLFVLDWYTLVLYPLGAATDEITVTARLKIPTGWTYGSVMTPIRIADGALEFPATSLATLVDSPVLAGRYLKTIELQDASSPPVFVHVATDAPEVQGLPIVWQHRLQRVVAESEKLFGGFPYRQFHFLIALSDEVGNDGLEHRESCDIRLSSQSFSRDANRLAYGYLLPHEYVHSWNGKFRIPSGLVTRDLQQPQTTELLWVYEGLTRYLNWVLAARAGILTTEEARDYAALLAAQTAYRSGREWRSLQDTAISTSMLIEAPDEWESLRRSVDYYDESLFIWLEADIIIRTKTGGNRSLDDFCRSFFGTPKNPPDILPYNFDDLLSVLQGVAPFDWKEFFQTRLNATGMENVPLNGLPASGWELTYRTTPGSVEAARDVVHKTIEERFSLGLLLDENGAIVDVVRDSPAWKAGIGPGMKVLAVNQRSWSRQALREATADDSSAIPLVLSLQNGSEKFDAIIRERIAASHPHLVRRSGQDLMSEILKPTISHSAPD